MLMNVRPTAVLTMLCACLPACAVPGSAADPAAEEISAIESEPRSDAAFEMINRQITELVQEAHRSGEQGSAREKQRRLDRLGELLLNYHADRESAANTAYLYTFQMDYPANTEYMRRFYEASQSPAVRNRLARSMISTYYMMHTDHHTSVAHRQQIETEFRQFSERLRRDLNDDQSLIKWVGLTLNSMDYSVGDRLQDVGRPRIGGGEDSLSRQRGKIVIVDFWATWCPPCVAGLPKLAKFYEEMSGKPLEVVSFSMDRKPQDVVEHMKSQPMPWVNLYVGMNSDLVEQWGISGYPTYFVLDADGVVRARVGELDADTKDFVRGLVAQLEAQDLPDYPAIEQQRTSQEPGKRGSPSSRSDL